MVTINGIQTEITAPCTVARYLEQKEYVVTRIVVELNGAILPKDRYGETMLMDGDVVEIVSFVGGG